MKTKTRTRILRISNLLLITSIIGIAGFVACDKQLDQGSENELTVKDAQQWFESKPEKFPALKTGGSEKPPKWLKPDWSKSTSKKFGKWEYVEALLLSQGSIGFATKESVEKYHSAGDPRYLNSLSRLVVLKDSDTKKMASFVMTIVAEGDYLEKNNFKLWENGYAKMDKSFSGYVFYHNIYGVFVSGWYYQNGKISKKATLNDGGFRPVQLKIATSGCIVYTIYVTEQVCTDWYQVGEDNSQTYDHTSCGEIVFSETVITVCDIPENATVDVNTGTGTGYYNVYPSMADLDAIYSPVSTLLPDHKEELARALNTFTEDPIHKALLDKLVQANVKIVFTIGGTEAASFQNNVISFRSPSNISAYALQEELVHAAQWNCFYDHTTFNTHIKSIEFEAKVFLDLAYTFRSDGTIPGNVRVETSEAFNESYINWVYFGIFESGAWRPGTDYTMFNTLCSQWSYNNTTNSSSSVFTSSLLSYFFTKH
jgi:hypothetical protein